MPGLTAHRLAVVKTLIESAPDAAIRSLDMALSVDPGEGPMAVIRDLVAVEAVQRRARAMTFGPAIPLCPAKGTLRHECFPKPIVAVLWRALCAARPEEISAVIEAAAARRNEEIAAAPFDALCAAAAYGLRSPGQAQFKAAVDMLDASEDGAAERFAAYLDLVPLSRAVLANLPDWLLRMTDERAAAVRLAFGDAVAVAPDAGPRFFEILIAQLDEPWQILRVVSGLMDRPADGFLAGSELAHIGDRLLTEIDRRLEALRNFDPSAGADAGRAAGEDARCVVNAIAEFETNIDLKRDGPWGVRIAKHKRELAQIVELRLSKVEEAVDQALPLKAVKLAGKLMKGVPKLTDDPQDRFVAKAEGFLTFLDKTRLSAATGGYNALRGKVVDKLEARLDQYAEDLIDELRDDGSALHDRARLYLELCARFVGYVRDEKAAQIVRRRAAA